ncbi:DinB family protein [Maribacter sp. 2307UL18-2]|uniref:DinB family protein n=1 Tax=Maribacter sp. 2307UL18-2 TaxID=3386274 RepID=UPI0039BCB1FB
MKAAFTSFFTFLMVSIQAQTTMNEDLPYSIIPKAPTTYTAGSVVARMIDGLGFRYYWATDGLTETDLQYDPGNEGRSIRQTMTHLYGLSEMIVNSARKRPTDRTVELPELTSEELRKATLANLAEASAIFLKAEDLKEHPIIFKRGDRESEFPFWNNINGPIADAIWHAGQIVVLRRSAGNPINSKVNVFLGKLND